MRKIIKKIPGFFLLIAGIIVAAHMIIPHDHHLSVSNLPETEKCPESSDNHKHHTGFPVHCHAFNDLTSERVTQYIIKEKSKSLAVYSVPFLVSHFCDPGESSISIYEFREPLTYHYFLELSLLRAPPSIG